MLKSAKIHYACAGKLGVLIENRRTTFATKMLFSTLDLKGLQAVVSCDYFKCSMWHGNIG